MEGDNMTQPEYLPYQGVDPYAADQSYLKVLSILHYVWGGLLLLLSCFAIIYIALGVMFLSGAMPMTPPPATGPAAANAAAFQQTTQKTMGIMFTACGTGGLLLGWAFGILTIISGRRIAQRRSRVFSMVIAGINCISFPFGTALGVFTFIMLSKESVKAMYTAGNVRP